jgi:flagellar basal body-associated protein FliL
MAEEKEESTEKEVKPKKPLNLSFLLLILNTIGTLILGGVVYYTKFIYKKPVITESQELEKLKAQIKKYNVPENKQVIVFEQQTINLATSYGTPHYITISIGVECRDEQVAANLNALKPIFNDRLIKILGQKSVDELNTVQGKLILKTDLLNAFNELIHKYAKESPEVPITEIYFNTYILQ